MHKRPVQGCDRVASDPCLLLTVKNIKILPKGFVLKSSFTRNEMARYLSRGLIPGEHLCARERMNMPQLASVFRISFTTARSTSGFC